MKFSKGCKNMSIIRKVRATTSWISNLSQKWAAASLFKRARVQLNKNCKCDLYIFRCCAHNYHVKPPPLPHPIILQAILLIGPACYGPTIMSDALHLYYVQHVRQIIRHHAKKMTEVQMFAVQPSDVSTREIYLSNAVSRAQFHE